MASFGTLGTLGDDHFKTNFTVHVKDITGKRKEGGDGRIVDRMEFEQTTTFNGHLQRLDGNFSLELSWVDLENNGHRVILPHKVIEAICNSRDRVLKKSRSEGAKKAFRTRKEQGTVPDIFLTKAEKEE